ncbi:MULTISPECIES: MFS transporter [Nocardia]|uniref:MFS transporter n=1 Tax=Nocardia TaxID=1817 RepID=UPI002E15FD26
MTVRSLRSTRSAPAEPAPKQVRPRRRWPVLLIVCATGFLVSKDISMHAIAVPTLLQQLGDRDVLAFSLWIPKSYVISHVAFLMLGGVLCDRFGPKPLLTYGYLGYLVGQFAHLALESTSLPLMIARILMGASAAAMVPAALATLLRVSAPGLQRAQAILLWGAAVAAGVTVVPLISALLLGHVWWTRVIAVESVIAIALFVGIVALVPTSRPDPDAVVDWPSVIATVAGAALLAFGFIIAPDWGWTAPAVLASLLAGFGLLVVATMTRRAGELPHDWLLRAEPRVRPAMFALATSVVATFGMVFLVVQYLQAVRTEHPVLAGLAIFGPTCAATGFGAWAGSALYRRTNTIVPLIVGLTTVLDGLAVGLLADVDGGLMPIVVMATVVNAGLAIVMTVALGAISAALPATRHGIPFAAQSVVVQLGSMLGVAVVSGLVGEGYKAKFVVPAQVAARDGLAVTGEPLGRSVATAISVDDQLGWQLAGAVRTAFLVGFRHGVVAILLVVAVMMAAILMLAARLPAAERARERADQSS